MPDPLKFFVVFKFFVVRFCGPVMVPLQSSREIIHIHLRKPSYRYPISSPNDMKKIRKRTGQDIILIFKKLCRLKKKTPHPKRYKQKSDTDSPEIDPPETSVCEPEMVT